MDEYKEWEMSLPVKLRKSDFIGIFLELLKAVTYDKLKMLMCCYNFYVHRRFLHGNIQAGIY